MAVHHESNLKEHVKIVSQCYSTCTIGKPKFDEACKECKSYKSHLIEFVGKD